MYKPYDKTLDNFMYFFGLFILFGGLISLFFIHKYNIDVTNLPAKCTLYEATGFYCPGCGGTRATVFLLKGNLLKSLHYHAFVAYTFFPWLWFLLTQTIYRFIKLISNKTESVYGSYPFKLLTPVSVRPTYLIVGLIILFAHCLAKNIAYIIGYPPF